MKKKGFTLIELLAVIVILAIIALIATPIIMNVIENSRKGAAERSAENYIDAVEVAVATERVKGKISNGEYTIQSDGSICPTSGCGEDEVDKVAIDMSGDKPSSGRVVIENGIVTTESNMSIGDYTVSYDSTKKAYVATKYQTGNTFITVYRFSTELIGIGNTIDPSEYTTDPTTLAKNVYLKHVLDKDNIVIETYACTQFNNKEICARGGSGEYYEENKLILNDLEECHLENNHFTCRVGSVDLNVDSDGYIGVDSDHDYCGIDGDGIGISGCESY